MQQLPEGIVTAPPGKKKRIFYGWYIVAAGVVSGFLNMAVFVEGLSVFLKDVRDELGWSVTAISLGFSLKSLESGALSPLSGYLIDRLGPRVMAVAGTIVMGAGLLLFAQMHSLWQFYLAGAVIALGQGMGGLNAFQASMVNWFYRKRGQASALLAMGRGWGYIGVLPVSLLLVAFGWRSAAAIAAITFVSISVPLALLLRHKPEQYGYFPDGADKAPEIRRLRQSASGAPQDSLTVKEALRSMPFWAVAISNLVYSFATQIQHVHMIPHLRNEGFTAAAAATVVAIYGVTQVPGRLGAGWVADRVKRYRLLAWSFLLLAMGWVALAFITPGSPWMVIIFYLTFGAGQAAHTVTAETIVADYFGTHRYATIRGFMSPIAVAGGVFGPLFAGVLFDMNDNYRVALMLLGPITLLGFIAVLMAGKPTLSSEEDRPKAKSAGE